MWSSGTCSAGRGPRALFSIGRAHRHRSSAQRASVVSRSDALASFSPLQAWPNAQPPYGHLTSIDALSKSLKPSSSYAVVRPVTLVFRLSCPACWAAIGTTIDKVSDSGRSLQRRKRQKSPARTQRNPCLKMRRPHPVTSCVQKGQPVLGASDSCMMLVKETEQSNRPLAFSVALLTPRVDADTQATSRPKPRHGLW